MDTYKYCEGRHVTDLILAEVASAAERLNPDLVERAIADVSAEASSLLARRYRQPMNPVPAIIRWIVSAIAAWRVVGAITSLMDTEAASDNQWLPVQKQFERAWDLLNALAAGRLKLGLEGEEREPDRENACAAVVTKGDYFDLSKF